MKKGDMRVGSEYAIKIGYSQTVTRARLVGFNRKMTRPRWSCDVPHIGPASGWQLFVELSDEGEPKGPVPEGAEGPGICEVDRDDRHMVSVRSRDVVSTWADWLVTKVEQDKAAAENEARISRETKAFRRESESAMLMLGGAVGKRVAKGASVREGYTHRSYTNGAAGKVVVNTRDMTVLLAVLIECLPLNTLLTLDERVEERRAALDAWVDDETGKVPMPSWLEHERKLREAGDGD